MKVSLSTQAFCVTFALDAQRMSVIDEKEGDKGDMDDHLHL